MNIERQGAGTIPRIEKGTASFALAGAFEGGATGTDAAPPSFAAVLTGLDTPALGGPDTELGERSAQGASATSATGLPDAANWPGDVAAILAGGAALPLDSRSAPQIAIGGQVDAPMLPGWVPLAVPTDLPARPVTGSTGGTHESPGDELPSGVLPGIAPPSPRQAGVSGVDTRAAQAMGAADATGLQPPRHPAGTDRGTDNTFQVATGDGHPARVASDTSKADGRAALAAQADRESFFAAPPFEVAAGGFKPLPGLAGQRNAERVSGRSVFVPLEGTLTGSGAASMASSHAPGTLMGVAGPEAPFPAGASSDVAHKVHYWITRGAQNAELQLDAFGGGAVDVSIFLRGNEALVEFRSDQPEARKLLQDAMPQLRDLLRSEGLELSGGFVGGSADRERQPGRDDPRGSSRRSGTVTIPGQTDGTVAQPRAAQGHALDIFV